MNGRIAGIVFLLVCVMLAILLLTKAINSTASAGIFAVALVILGGLSKGFRKSNEES